ncbi:uncharacterized protein [Drosophila pseudoobscura]|uniref:Uncharacterized protein isoform X1 n=1 Tax=Drosophila pseudoobscura pseudoobscura TaxID=46245 RepID=A0A6I8VLS5_DROPS|nr:uncharacterized protein LOC6899977 isoform X1 [Drosophila pseudoobscura]
MDPAKVIGKLKEQVRMEHKSRRNYPEVWHQISDNATNRFYHQNEIDSQLKGQLKLQELCPFVHDNKGESRFVSPEMYNSLLSRCRCGRSRRGPHMGKCLQRTVSPDYDYDVAQPCAKDSEGKKGEPAVPRTSNSSIGLLGIQTSYRKLEQSMQYVSPTFSMPGPRITAVPYNIIVIG